MNECIFCQIVKRKITAKIVYEDDAIISFHDVEPSFDTHVLILPKKHIISLNHLVSRDINLIGRLTIALSKVAKTLGLQSGYKVLINTGALSGQTVFHLHYHLFAGLCKKDSGLLVG